MKKAVPVFLFAVLIVVFGFQARSAEAWSTYSTNGSTGNCAACHGDFTSSPYTSPGGGPSWGDSLHNVHRNTMLSGDCNTCHGSGGRSPVVLDSSVGGSGLSPISCVGCHGRTQDGGNDSASGGLGAGLRQHHTNAGINTCAGCHTDANPANYTPVGENVLPPYYGNSLVAHPNMPTNPCNLDGNENFAGGSEGLDNDGDGVYDGADSDCATAATPQIGVDPTSHDYGSVTVGSSASQEFTISNKGTADLHISNGVLSDETNFAVDGNSGSSPCGELPVTITPDNNCTVSIAFSPQDAITYTATVTISSDDPVNPSLVVDLTGTGVAGTAPDITVDPATFDYGSITVGDNTSHVFTVSNAGNDNLVLGTVAQANPLAAPFSIIEDNCSLQTLVPAANCTLTVQFAPNATSPFTDSFDIPSNDPDENPVTVTVDGTGTGVPVPDIAVTDSVAPNDDLEVPFGDVRENTSSDQTVTVTNNGTADLVLGTVAFTDNLAAPFSIPAGMDSCSDTTLAQSESCTITVQFAPTALVASNDTFDIPSDDPDTPSVTVAVSGTGVANIAPTAPTLVLPADGATGLPTSVTFEWNESTDTDGDPVTYNLFVCANDNTFATCPDPVNTAPITASASGGKGIAFAASGMGVMFFGVAFVAGIGRKKTVALLLAMALAAGVLMVACGDDDGGSSSPHGQVSFTQLGLTTTTTYYWKVVANDGTDSTDSATRSFTTQ
jgi:hypothetical protein